MMTKEEVFEKLRKAFAERKDAQDKRDGYLNDTSGWGYRSLELYSRLVQEVDKGILDLLDDLIRFPPHLSRQFDVKRRFYEKGAEYENSVFIMTKFPRPDLRDPQDQQLAQVIKDVIECLCANGYYPRIASEPRPPYKPSLWDNVEAYLFCCGNGVAIVEDKYKEEFNPNVAMEWGWMRATDRRVLYLLEKDFQHMRADTSGLLYEEFAWDAPLPGIQAAITKYFPKRVT